MNFLFVRQNTPANPLLDALIQNLGNRHIRTSATNRNEFKAFLYSPTEIYAFAVGRYPISILDSFTVTRSLAWTAILDWIETTPAGRGRRLCSDFLSQILQQLIALRLLHLEMVNVGGQIACKCYVSAAEKVGAIPCYFDGKDFIRTTLDTCTRNPEISLIILPEAAAYHPNL